MLDFMPTADWDTGMHQGSTGAEVGAGGFFTVQPMACVNLKHNKQLKIGNTKFT